jgi:hypothetical protein
MYSLHVFRETTLQMMSLMDIANGDETNSKNRRLADEQCFFCFWNASAFIFIISNFLLSPFIQ